jgi:hypothetical protein
MPVMDNTVTVDLNKGIRFASVDIGEDDANANLFGAEVVSKGKPENIDGAAVQGHFIREDRKTIDVTGSVKGNVAYVVLTPDCYAVVGRYQLTLKIILDNAKTTLRIIEGRVLRTRTDGSGSGGGGTPSLPDEPSTVAFSVDAEGNARITGAILTVDAEGNATLTGYTPSVDGDGDATIG